MKGRKFERAVARLSETGGNHKGCPYKIVKFLFDEQLSLFYSPFSILNSSFALILHFPFSIFNSPFSILHSPVPSVLTSVAKEPTIGA